MLWAKKNSYKEFDNEKKFLGLENSPTPHSFSNGPSLTTLNVVGGFFLLSDVVNLSRESPVTHTTSIFRAKGSFSAVKGSFTT